MLAVAQNGFPTGATQPQLKPSGEGQHSRTFHHIHPAPYPGTPIQSQPGGLHPGATVVVVLQSQVVVPGSLLVVVVPQFGCAFAICEHFVHVQSPSALPQNVGYKQLHGAAVVVVVEVVVLVVVVVVVLVVVVGSEQSPLQPV